MPLVSAAPCIERPGVIAGFVLSIGSGLTPTTTRGLLFAQDEMYRPATAPVLPEATPNQQSWLYYNSSAGFYWADTPAPYVSDDAFVGWVLAGAAEIRAVSSQRIQTEPAEDSPAVIPVVMQSIVPAAVPNVMLFKAGHSNGDGTFELVMYWDAMRGMMLIDWGCMAPADTSNWLGLQIWLKIPDGDDFRYVKTSGTIGIDQFAEAEDGSRYIYDTIAVQLESVPEDPEEWLIIAASVDASGALKVDGLGNPSGPSVALMTLDKSDYAQDFDADVVTKLGESGEELWGIASTWANPPVPRYVKTRILLLDYQAEGSVQQLSGDNPLTDLESLCGFWPWPAAATNVRLVVQSIFGDGTVAAIEDCPYVDLTIDRTLGTVGQEYCGLVTNLALSSGAYATNPDGQKVFRCVLSWTPPAADNRYAGGSLWVIRGSTHHQLGGLDFDRFDWESSHWPTTAENVTFYVLSVDTLNRRNTYEAGVTPTLAYTWNPPTLGSAGAEYTSNVTGFAVTVTYPAQADGTYRALVSNAFTKPSVATWGALSIQIKPSGGTWAEVARGSVTPIEFTLPVGIVATTFAVGAFGVDVNGHVNSYSAGVTPTQDIIVGNAAGQLDFTKAKATTYDPDIFKIESGEFIVWAMNGSLIVTGSISSSKLNATSINVGGGGSKPGEFAVYNASGNQIGFIGVEDGYSGAWFKSLGIGGSSKAAPKITADSNGAVSIDGASITVTGTFDGRSQTLKLDPSGLFPVYIYSSSQYLGITDSWMRSRDISDSAAYPYWDCGRTSASGWWAASSGSDTNKPKGSFTAIYGASDVDRYVDLNIGITDLDRKLRFFADRADTSYLDIRGAEVRITGSKAIDTSRDFWAATKYSVGTKQVVGAQGAAVADPTVSIPTSGSVVADACTGNLYNYLVELEAKLKDLRDRIKAHGLIAAS